MEQKVIQVGNSFAVTLPRDFVKKKNLKAGQKVFVEADADMDMVQIRTNNRAVVSLTPEFKHWLDRVTEEYEHAIKELAKR